MLEATRRPRRARAGSWHAGALAALAVASFLAPSARALGTAHHRAQAGAWTTYGGSNARTSLQPASPPLRPLRPRWTSRPLDGAIYGEPLIAGGRVYVATEADVVYALDASTGRRIWARRLGTPVPAAALPCGDISPTVGVTSTMVLDPHRARLYVSAATFAQGTVHHLLVALDATTGATAFSRDLDQPGWVAADQLQRAALALASGMVYVGFGGNYGDCGRYAGYVVGVPTSGRGRSLAYRVPVGDGGAIWAPAGIAVNRAGDLYAATGNSAPAAPFNGGEAVLELSPSLRRIGVFAPSDFAAASEDDLDLGSTAPVLLPDGHVLIVGKQGVAYLLDGARLGGIGSGLAHAKACDARGGNAYDAGMLDVACPGASLTALRVGARSLALAWRAPAGIDGSPTLASGLVWCIAGSELVGLSPRTGVPAVRVRVIPTEHFAAPSAGEGLLVVGGSSEVEAFEGPSGFRA